MAGEEGEKWSRETAPRVLAIVVGGARLRQRDLYAVLLVSPACYRALLAVPELWKVLDFHEGKRAGERLILALSLARYKNIKEINMEFAQDFEDKHLFHIKSKGIESLKGLETLNLNACQKITDKGIEAITIICPNLNAISLYWNVGLTNESIKHIVKNCKHIIDLNLSGCKNITDKSMLLIADKYPNLEKLNITRCIKLTDNGLLQILTKCSFLQSLNLYALSSFTEKVYMKMGLLNNLIFLDLCGAQNLTDEGLYCIAQCENLISLNLTWCVRVTDLGVIAIAQGCKSLQFLSLFGILGVTDACLEALSKTCSHTLTTLDVNGCIGIKRRSRVDLLKLFPHLTCFKVHS
ncbi:hypothetical protein LUZ60_005197 [Juncus effusus]|nr:hypothetical protein LUZ60_005197 [Juncus effusus]